MFRRPNIQIPSSVEGPPGRQDALDTAMSAAAPPQGAAMPWPAISPKELPSPEQAAW